jgi:hypothetical protein
VTGRLARAAALALVLAALVLGASRAHQRVLAERALWPRTDERVWAPQPSAARFLALGANEMMADVFWARLVLYYGGGMLEGSSLVDVEPLVEVINAYDPQFRRPYVWGSFAATYRSKVATQEEYRASIAILERAVKAFPEDWELYWMLGLRYYLDLQGKDADETQRLREIGAAHIEHAMHLPGAPDTLPLLAASMRTRLGQKVRALSELRAMILAADDEATREKLLARYQSMASEDAGASLREAARDFAAEWRANLACAPPSLYVLVGPRPSPAFDLAAMAAGGEETAFAADALSR